jgi:uncharacterized protein (DUF983 family)
MSQVLDVNHADLQPVSGDAGALARQCPACNKGSLQIHRDRATLAILAEDVCTLCGQRVRYLDIDTLRAHDWAHGG